MEKLELKHLVGYLPYGLKIADTRNDETWILHAYKDALDNLSNNENLSLQNFFEENETESLKDMHKPILRPLSDLTKEIEINGRKFVPIIELLKLKYPKQEKEGRYSKITVGQGGYPSAWFTISANKEIMIQLFSYELLPYWLVEKLFEWHFDFFGLIKENLAIDINTL